MRVGGGILSGRKLESVSQLVGTVTNRAAQRIVSDPRYENGVRHGALLWTENCQLERFGLMLLGEEGTSSAGLLFFAGHNQEHGIA